MKLQLTGDLKPLTNALKIWSDYEVISLGSFGHEIEMIYDADVKGAKLVYDGKSGKIYYAEVSEALRALQLYTFELKKGQAFEQTFENFFDVSGVMPDVSRNGVLNVQAVKRMLIDLSKIGLNMAQLYTEDTYELERHPYFGYLRGRYTGEELRELDDFAHALGIELIPNIQTLGHLSHLLKYHQYSEIKDTETVLLVGEPKTYEFIEEAVSGIAQHFRTKRIHIGMDEAWDLGQGQYRQLHGVKDPFSIMNEHIQEVVKITKKLGLEPMIWSDMYYRIGSETGDYYDLNSQVPQEVLDSIPDVDLVYWDYYHEDEKIYDQLIENHLAIGQKVIFAGGGWTWNGIAPNYGKAFETTKAALQSCKTHGIREAFITLWGDDGQETPHFTALPVLHLFSYLSYYDELDETHLAELFEHITGFSWDEFMLLDRFDQTPGVRENNLGTSAASKVLLWQDPLLGIFDKDIEGLNMASHYVELAEALESVNSGHLIFDFYRQFAKVLALKSEYGLRVKAAYDADDQEELERGIQVAHAIVEEISRLRKAHLAVWMHSYKAFGWEVLDIRYGGVMARMQTVIFKLQEYLIGNISSIEELEAEKLPFQGAYDLGEGVIGRGLYADIVTPNRFSGV